MSTDDPVELANAMSKVLRALEGGRRGRSAPPTDAVAVGGVFGRWDEVVGEAMAQHVQPIRLDGDRLVVEVSEPAWATQVRILGDRIRSRLVEVAGVHVERLDVRVASRRR